MKYKTLLLGTAAVFAVGVAGSARAADLAVAESVEYVKVCDAYGTGYFYIPGSDTCLKIAGDVEVLAHYDSKPINDGTVLSSAGEDDLNWWFRTEGDITATSKSMTDWGMLTGLVNFRGREALGTVNTIYMETAYLSIGGFTAGWLASQFDGGVPFGLIGGPNFDHDQHQNQFSWTTKAGPWGLTLSVEDPNNNPGAASPFEPDFPAIPGYSGANATWNGGFPDIVAAVTGGGGPFKWKAAVGVTDTTAGTGWGAKVNGTWTQGANSFGIMGQVSNGPGSLYGANIYTDAYGSGTYWMTEASAGIGITSATTLWLLGGYQAAPGHSAWEVQAELDWAVGKDAKIGAWVGYTSLGCAGCNGLGTNDNFSDTAAEIRFQRTFAGGAD